MKVAYQGVKGAFSEQAAKKYFADSKEMQTIACRTFEKAFEAVENGEAEYGMIPIENFLSGSINETYDLLHKHDLFIVGEFFLPVRFCLIGKGPIENVKKVYSHPQGLAQCADFINENGYQTLATFDTAGSVKEVAERGEADEAGLASEIAADIYGLKVLAKDINTDKGNVTRFIVISKNEADDLDGINSDELKSSLVFSVKHIPAALYKCLGGFATNKVNLTKLESRPIRGEHGQYFFILDFEGKKQDECVKLALEELNYFTESVKFLGTYKKGCRPD